MQREHSDPILKAADHVTASGDALFAGESQDCYLVHVASFDPGYAYHSDDGSVALRVVRRATEAEYRERCPHIPALFDLSRYFIYLTRRVVN